MQPMWLCICALRQFEKTFENQLWKKVVQMQPMRLRICSLRRFENTFETHNGEKLYKCNYASVLTVNLRRHLKTQSWEKSFKYNQRDSHHFIQTIWENTGKLTLEKVIEMQPMRLYASVLAGNVKRHLKTHSGEKSFICNQRDFAYVHSDDLRKHLKLTLE